MKLLQHRFFITLCGIVFASSVATAQESPSSESAAVVVASPSASAASHTEPFSISVGVLNGMIAGANSQLIAGGNGYVGGTAGFWYRVVDSINLGFNLGFNLDTGIRGQTSAFGMTIAPMLKYYLPGKRVRPFVLAGVEMEISHPSRPQGPEIPGEKTTDFGLTIIPGFGAEWFITQEFSLAAHIGLAFQFLRIGAIDPLAMTLFTSGLSVQIYF